MMIFSFLEHSFYDLNMYYYLTIVEVIFVEWAFYFTFY